MLLIVPYTRYMARPTARPANKRSPYQFNPGQQILLHSVRDHDGLSLLQKFMFVLPRVKGWILLLEPIGALFRLPTLVDQFERPGRIETHGKFGGRWLVERPRTAPEFFHALSFLAAELETLGERLPREAGFRLPGGQDGGIVVEGGGLDENRHVGGDILELTGLEGERRAREEAEAENGRGW